MQTQYEKVQLITIDDGNNGQRIDNFLISKLKGVPKSRLYRILRKGEVRVNKSRVKPEYKLELGDVVRVPPIRVAAEKPKTAISQALFQYLEQAVLYEDAYFLVINKPAGIAVHGDDAGSPGLIEALREVRKDCRFLELVHRIDKETSGCLMVAKKRSALKFLQEHLKTKTEFKKSYLALTMGVWKEKSVFCDAPLERVGNKSNGQFVRISEEGKSSQTNIQVLQQFVLSGVGQFSLIEAVPITGRTHQIRVHAQYLGHALVGDDKYGNDEINACFRKLGLKRLFLHAQKLEIPNPDPSSESRKFISVEAPIPEDLRKTLDLIS
ncbi:23S rRNA pseudouridine(955/2504/2580) synthase RluC [Sessilibacter sp. MAH1]